MGGIEMVVLILLNFLKAKNAQGWVLPRLSYSNNFILKLLNTHFIKFGIEYISLVQGNGMKRSRQILKVTILMKEDFRDANSMHMVISELDSIGLEFVSKGAASINCRVDANSMKTFLSQFGLDSEDKFSETTDTGIEFEQFDLPIPEKIAPYIEYIGITPPAEYF